MPDEVVDAVTGLVHVDRLIRIPVRDTHKVDERLSSPGVVVALVAALVVERDRAVQVPQLAVEC